MLIRKDSLATGRIDTDADRLNKPYGATLVITSLATLGKDLLFGLGTHGKYLHRRDRPRSADSQVLSRHVC